MRSRMYVPLSVAEAMATIAAMASFCKGALSLSPLPIFAAIFMQLVAIYIHLQRRFSS